MSEDKGMEQIRRDVSALDREAGITKQRVDSHEEKIERVFGLIGEVKSEHRIASENFRRSTDRLFETVNQINGGIKMLKWAIPIWISVAAIFVAIIVAANQTALG